MVILQATLNTFWEDHPGTTYETLCSLVQWTIDNNVRYATPANLVRGAKKYAYQAGYMPELEPPEEVSEIDKLLLRMLTRENDSAWNEMLMDALDKSEDTKVDVANSWIYWRG